MRRWVFLVGGMLAFFLSLFLVFEGLGISVFDEQAFLSARGWVPAAMAVGLLVVDVVIPIPSSLILVSLGSIYGLALGALVGTAGSVLAAAAGFLVGRHARGWVDRLISEPERRRAARWLERWGGVAIIVSRPLPMLAETVAILAGASAMTWPRMLTASLLGALPGALICAWAGATAGRLESGIWAFLLTLAVAAAVWLAGWGATRFRTGGGQTRPPS